MPYFQMALGMAEYRCGDYAAAEEALIAAARLGTDNYIVTGTTSFYRAMTLFRQGKEDEARKLAVQVASQMRSLPADERNPLAPNSSHDDLILWLAYKEAKALLGLSDKTP
jgi:hypothetical protein